MWALGRIAIPGGFGIYYRSGNFTTSWTQVTGAAVRIAAGSGTYPSHAWVVNSAHNIYSFNGSKFVLQPGLAATDIATGGDGSVWALGSVPIPGGYAIYRWKGGTSWARVSGAAVKLAVLSQQPVSKVSAGPMAWAVNSAHHIFVSHNNGATWAGMTESANDIAVSGYGLGANLSGPYGSPTVWIVTTELWPGGYRLAYQSVLHSSWQLTNLGAVAVGVDFNGSPWFIESPSHYIVGPSNP